MSEDDVEAERNQQGGDGRDVTPAGGTPPADGLGLSGSGRIGGRRPSGLGLKGEPNQLLVLLGDTGGERCALRGTDVLDGWLLGLLDSNSGSVALYCWFRWWVSRLI